MLNPVHLRTLAMVVHTGSFADAARRLGYTASAVSQQVAALERAVRLPLFERDPHGVRATPAAHFLTARARDVLSSLTALEDSVREMAEGNVGRFRLGTFPTASQRLLPYGLAAYLEAHPGIEILLDEGEPEELILALQDGELDMVLVYRYDLVPRSWPKDLVSNHLLHEDLVLLLPKQHRLAESTVITLNDLENDTWVASREFTSGAACLTRACARAGFVPQVAFRSNDYAVIRGFVSSGLGIALIPALGYDSSPDLVATSVQGLDIRRHVAALHRSSGQSPAVEGALAGLRRGAAELMAADPLIS